MALSQCFVIFLILLFINKYATAVTIPQTTNHHRLANTESSTPSVLYTNLNETTIDVMSILIPPATVQPDIQLLKKEDARQ